MRTAKVLQVRYKGDLVGTLATTADRRIAFAYEDSWIRNGFSISPFSLPLRKQVFFPVKNHFRGLFGVFADSLPDAWGNLLLDRMLRKQGISPDTLNALDRLAIVGSSGMGALTYEPEFGMEAGQTGFDLDEIARQCAQVLKMEYGSSRSSSKKDTYLDELYRLGGTSGGARPKILTEVDGEDWIIKFPAHVDGPDVGRMEYDYSLCARACGIDMPQTRLFPSAQCGGYFGVKRFDRIGQSELHLSKGREQVPNVKQQESGGENRIHMLTAAALLELDFEQPSLDYHGLMKLTKILTRDHPADVENMFRRMCFNVFAHNRDDHSKNFSFLYDDAKREWRLSPAYDLTYSTTYYGEHTTTVDGEGARPGRKQLLAVGEGAGLGKKRCGQIVDEIEETVGKMLGKYLESGF